MSRSVVTRIQLIHFTGCNFGFPWRVIKGYVMILYSSVLTLCCSVGEYCAPVWFSSACTRVVDTQLNHTNKIITGALKPTKFVCLPVLANIPPPNIWHQNAANKLIIAVQQMPPLTLFRDIWDAPCHWLCSRHPIWTVLHTFHPADIFSSLWWTEWERASTTNRNSHIITRTKKRQPGLESQLNRFTVAWFTLPWPTMPGSSRTAHCAAVVLWRVQCTCWMVTLFALGSMEVFLPWTLLTQRPLTDSRPLIWVFLNLSLLILPKCGHYM